jgi:hypothetical protein
VVDDRAGCGTHRCADGEINQVATVDELLETLQHEISIALKRTKGPIAAREWTLRRSTLGGG